MAIEYASRVRAQTFYGLQTFADGISVSGTATISGDVLFSGSVAHGTATFDGDGFISAKGLRVGPTATAPGTGEAVFTGGIRTGTATAPSAGHIAVGGGLRIGPTATEPSAGHIAAKGLRLGAATEPGTGHIRLDGAIGLGTATQPSAGAVGLPGAITAGNGIIFGNTSNHGANFGTVVSLAADAAYTLGTVPNGAKILIRDNTSGGTSEAIVDPGGGSAVTHETTAGRLKLVDPGSAGLGLYYNVSTGAFTNRATGTVSYCISVWSVASGRF